MPEGCSFSLDGESSTVNLMVDEMVQWMALALPFVYLVMVAQFQSLLSPFIVLFTVPLAFTGGLLGMLVTGQQLTMISLMGFIVLMVPSSTTVSSSWTTPISCVWAVWSAVRPSSPPARPVCAPS